VQAALQREALLHRAAQLLRRHLVRVAADRFRPIHRVVGILQQRFGVFAILGINGDAYTRGDVEPLPFDVDRFGDDAQYALGHRRDVLLLFQLLPDDSELVAANSRDDITFADARSAPGGDLASRPMATSRA